MKHLTLIVHTDIQQDLTNQLRTFNEISGFTFSSVEGHGIETEKDAFLSARDKVVGYTPRVRVDILLESEQLEAVLSALREISGIKENGIYWVTDVDKGGRL